VGRGVEVDLLHFCAENKITVIAYGPLAHGINHIQEKDPRAIQSKVAALAGKTEAQVALNCCISRKNVITIPKASSVEHVVENCHTSGWRLSPWQNRLLEKTIKFRRGGRVEAAIRRAVRAILQRLGYNQ
jgi:diketogulonate reductase-like aldo/keto reductase